MKSEIKQNSVFFISFAHKIFRIIYNEEKAQFVSKKEKLIEKTLNLYKFKLNLDP